MKLLTTGYPSWDYAYLMQLISDWTKQSSKHFTKYSHHTCRDKSAKELLIVSEYTNRLANGTAWDEEVIDLKKVDGLEKEYIEAMLKIIRRKLKAWWY